ncbi:hypothetical protein [Nonomuraea sediminis]|uniref:hypothetical protein n=1 Tax=Nonomuraea sediminis TaxID=2835864 RepID=UPI001BDCC3E5|nr:hypothetical protein [Nonomuraea sediminis]
MKLLPLLAAVLFLLVPASAAWADPSDPTPSDVAQARAAAVGARDTVGKFFATHGQPAKDRVAPVAAQVDGPTVTVNDLNPAFVSGQSQQIARFAFLATQATAPDGQTASIWTTRIKAGTWVVSNIASGSDEQQYAAQPGTVFREPQLNAWYALRDGQVHPLNQEAVQSTGSNPVPVATYQRLVQQRYGDKLPGSSYALDGYAGGYAPQAPANPLLPWVLGTLALAAAIFTIHLLRRRA